MLGRESFDDIVHIVVGPEKKVFKIHKEILCNASTYFRAALNGGFKEAKEQKVEMPEDKVSIFKYFQHWLYSGNILVRKEWPSDGKIEEEWYKAWDILVEVYSFGETRGIPLLQNAAIDCIIDMQQATNTVYVESNSFVYKSTPGSSPLRRLYVDLFHSSAHVHQETAKGSWFCQDMYEKYDKEFLFDVATAYCRRVHGEIEGIADFTAVRANYHVPVPE